MSYTFLSGINPEEYARLSGHKKLCDVLDLLNYQYDTVVGVWQGRPELSVRVFNITTEDGTFLLRQFGQGSMLRVENGQATLINSAGIILRHFNGIKNTTDWREVSQLDSYTVLPEGDFIYFYEL